MGRSLLGQGHPLATLPRQHEVLAACVPGVTFAGTLAGHGLPPLAAAGLETLQLNLGKVCNQTCRHCHVDAGPDRTERMGPETIAAALRLVDCVPTIRVVDLTGGAPELHPEFRPLVEAIRARGRHVMDRCNLTILQAGPFRDLPAFLARHEVEVVASLPSFQPSGTDAQRGRGVFEASLASLRELNALGYGREGSGLALNLVTNPVGAFLPARQASLERDYRRELRRRFGVEFNRLFVLTNLPINRYLQYLVEIGQHEAYMGALVRAFNPAAVPGLMCRTLLSVGWDGRLHDCDFNQVLDLPLADGLPRTILDAAADPSALASRPIRTGLHCFGCTAGQGSSCGGAVTPG
jgi:radical SAM/Cys-rich protein